MVRHNPCLPQNGSTKSLQNGEAQPLHYQEFSLQNGFGANEPLKKRQPLQNGSGQPDFFRPLKSIKCSVCRWLELTLSVGEMGRLQTEIRI